MPTSRQIRARALAVQIAGNAPLTKPATARQVGRDLGQIVAALRRDSNDAAYFNGLTLRRAREGRRDLGGRAATITHKPMLHPGGLGG